MQINHSEFSLELQEKLFHNEQYADISFSINKEKIRAIRAIVANSSPVFHSMLYGKMKESQQNEIKIEDPLIEPHSFKDLLRYINKKKKNF